MHFKSLLSLSLLIALISCNHTPRTLEVAPADPALTYMGRILWQDSLAPTFSYPGTTVLINFEGSALDMKASAGAGQFMVAIDNTEPVKINFDDSTTVINLADSLFDGQHSARIVYAIEGYEKHPEIHGFTVTGQNPKLLPTERPDFKLEFIGNSITCGYGSEADDPTIRFSYETENHTLSYAYLTARALDADCNVVARSGIGIYRNYGGPREGTDLNMPSEYDNTLLYVDDYKWDHESFHPEIICINLGTNDTSLNDYDISLYEQSYAAFLKHLRKLHPLAKIVLLSGSMMSGQALDDVKDALDRLAATDDNIYRFDMTPQTGDLGYGADYHPSAAQHRKMADELISYLQSLR